MRQRFQSARAGRALPFPAALGVAYALVTALLFLAIFAANIVNRPFGDFSSDPTFILEGPSYIGFLSQTGMVIWSIAMAAGLLAWWVLGRSPRSPFLWSAVLTGCLLADDLFQVHEYLPSVGIAERLALVVYAMAFLAYSLVFRRFVWRQGYLLFALTIVLLASSGAMDHVTDELGDESLYALDDVPKLFAIATWATFLVGAAARELGNELTAARAVRTPVGALTDEHRPAQGGTVEEPDGTSARHISATGGRVST